MVRIRITIKDIKMDEHSFQGIKSLSQTLIF